MISPDFVWVCFKLREYKIDILHSLANGPGHLGSIPGHVIPKTFKMVLDTSLLNTQQYKAHIKGKKWSNYGKGVVPSLTPQCGSY